MDAQTHEVKLPSGKIAVLRDSLTGEDFRVLRGIAVEGKTVRERMDNTENKLFELVVVSLDGSSENVLQRALAGSAGDFGVLSDAASDVRYGRFTKAA